ncbi:hypothetical protein KCU74_g109, partial [Aureobasidium melanogenum]
MYRYIRVKTTVCQAVKRVDRSLEMRRRDNKTRRKRQQRLESTCDRDGIPIMMRNVHQTCKEENKTERPPKETLNMKWDLASARRERRLLKTI